MDNLFTPEVIAQFLKLLETAANGGTAAVILWLILPALIVLISAIAWCSTIAYTINKLLKAYSTYAETSRIAISAKLDLELKPKPVTFQGILITGVEDDLADLLRDVRRSTGYVHANDIRNLRKAWEAYNERVKTTS